MQQHKLYMKPSLARIEKSIRSHGVIGALIGLCVSILFGYPLSWVLGIETGSCVKCQDNGLLWAIIFFVGIPVLTLLGYLGMMHFRSYQLVRNGTVTKQQLLEMKRYDSLYDDHEF